MADEWLEEDLNGQELESTDFSHKDSEHEESIVNASAIEDSDDPEIAAIKARVKEMEEEAAKLKEMQKQAEETLMSPSHSSLSVSSEAKGDVDGRSVYVGNVDYSATATDLEQHFHGCGSVNRVTILCDKFSGHPKGFAYVEFTDKESVDNACQLTDSLFKGRQIKVNPKRTNIPGISSTNRGRWRGRGRGFSRGYSGFHPRARGRGSYRSRRAQWYSPY